MKTAGWACLLPLAYAIGCGGPQELGKAGAKCYRDDDCEAGLICVAPEGKTVRVCSSDPTPIVSMVDGPPVAEGGTAGAPAAGTGTGGAGTAGATTSGTNAGGAASAGTATGGAAGNAATAGRGGAASGGGGSASAGADTAGTGGIAPEAGAAP